MIEFNFFHFSGEKYYIVVRNPSVNHSTLTYNVSCICKNVINNSGRRTSDASWRGDKLLAQYTVYIKTGDYFLNVYFS